MIPIPQPLILTFNPPPGCYAHDATGAAWATFTCINHTVTCVLCGAQITGGWEHGDLFICVEHVQYAPPRPTDAATVAGIWGEEAAS